MGHWKILTLLMITPAVWAAGWFAPEYDGASGNGFRLGRFRPPPQKAEIQAPKPGPGKLVGHCTLLAGGGNLIEGPCDSALLILDDDKGQELVRTRTDKNGEFLFEAPTDGKFRIASGSRFIEVVSPMDLLHSGIHVDLKLKQKSD